LKGLRVSLNLKPSSSACRYRAEERVVTERRRRSVEGRQPGRIRIASKSSGLSQQQELDMSMPREKERGVRSLRLRNMTLLSSIMFSLKNQNEYSEKSL
jgi:hypothetical protein